MKKFTLSKIQYRDILFLTFISSLLFTIILLMTHGKYIYGCRIDWLSQHSVLPDYFRQTFYDTHNLFPQFSLNLGAGQNAYNFAYYGYFNPIILISYFLPFVPMEDYIAVSSIFVLIFSIILFFYWMKSKKIFSTGTLYTSTLLFGLAAPLLYHSHKQVMFMDYMPFLILALIGVDRLFTKNKKGLLAVSIALMFLTSYFFAFSAMFAITIYALYKYVQQREMNQLPSGSVKSAASRYIISATTGILLSCIIILPAFFAILSGRGDGAKGNSTCLKSLLLPKLSVGTICYSPYGIGTVGIFIIALFCVLIFTKKKSHRLLTVCLLLFTAFPVAKYFLNGFLYDRSKALIPFLPLVIWVIAIFIDGFMRHKFNGKKLCFLFAAVILFLVTNILLSGHRGTSITLMGINLFLPEHKSLSLVLLGDVAFTGIMLYISKKIKNYMPLYSYLVLAALICCVANNFDNSLISKSDAEKYYSTQKANVINSSLETDDAVYRTSDLCNSKFTNNHIFNQRYYSVGGYSSVLNQNYIHLCNYDLRINNPTVNDISIVPTSDILFDTLMGVKYISSNSAAPAGYSEVAHSGVYKMYQTENAYSLGFASEKKMSLNEFSALSPEEKQLALLEYVVVDENLNNVYENKLEKVNIDMRLGLKKHKDGYYHINTTKESKLFTIDTPDNLKDYVYIVKCHIKKYTKKRATIRVNGIQNSLSGRNNAFPNKNFDFKFVVSSNEDLYTLTFEFPKDCNFRFSDFEIYRMKYEDVVKLKDNITMMENITFTNDCKLEGDITVVNDSTFTTTIPYDKGFHVYVDGEKTDYIKTDNAFIGLNLKAGSHHIELIYRAPFSMIGNVLSILGIVLLAGFYIKPKDK